MKKMKKIIIAVLFLMVCVGSFANGEGGPLRKFPIVIKLDNK